VVESKIEQIERKALESIINQTNYQSISLFMSNSEMGTVQNKSTAVPVLGTGSRKYLGTASFFKKYRSTDIVLGTVLCKLYEPLA